MNGWVKALLIAIVISLAVVSYFAIRTYLRAGEATTLLPRFDGQCELISAQGFLGEEDMALDTDTGLIWASSLDRRVAWRGDAVQGGLWSFALNADLKPALSAHAQALPSDFKPHGIAIQRGRDGAQRLYVVNHTGTGDQIDVFIISGGTEAPNLTFEHSLTSPLLVHANDLTVTRSGDIYVSLDTVSEQGSIGQMLEGVFSRKTGQVLLIPREGEPRIVARKLFYANGIALSDDETTLYVAETIGRALTFYDRDADTGALTWRERGFLGTGADNITVDADGRLFIGAHPKLLTFSLGHARNARSRAPSQVIMVDPKEQVVDQVYLSLGADFSGSSTAIVDVDQRRMVIGAVFDPGVLSCRLPQVWRHSVAYPAATPQHAFERDGG